MKNLIKILSILLLSMFIITGCADSNNNGNGGISSGIGTSGKIGDLILTKLNNVGEFFYGETEDGKRYIWGNVGELAEDGNVEYVSNPLQVSFTIYDNITYNNTYYILTSKGLYICSNIENIMTPKKVNGLDGNILKVHKGYDYRYALTDKGLYVLDGLEGIKFNGIEGNIKDIIAVVPSYDKNFAFVLTDNSLYMVSYDGYVKDVKKIESIEGNIKEIINTRDSNRNAYNRVFVLTDNSLYVVSYGTYIKEDLTVKKIESIEGNIKEIINTGDPSSHTYHHVFVLTDNSLYVVNCDTYIKEDLTVKKIESIEGNIKEIITPSDISSFYDYHVFVLTDNGLYMVSCVGKDIPVKKIESIDSIEGTVKDSIFMNMYSDFLYSDPYTYYFILTSLGLYGFGIASFEDDIKVSNILKIDNMTNITNIPNAILYVQSNNNIILYTDTGIYKIKKESVYDENFAEFCTVLRIDNNHYIDNVNVKKIINYNNTTYALTNKGLYATGNNQYNQLGNGLGYSATTPYKVMDGNINDIIFYGSKNETTYYVLKDEGLYAWGYNSYYQVGNDTTGVIVTPYKIEEIEGIVNSIVISGSKSEATYYVATDKGLYTWGYNSQSNIGESSNDKYVKKPYKLQIKVNN